MPVYYLETSALLKRYRTERGSETIDELFDHKQDVEVFVTSHLTTLEVTSVATGLLRAGHVSRRSHQQMLADLAVDLRQLILVHPVSDSVLSEALTLILNHGLRAPDSIHLATALIVRSSATGQASHFVCADARLKAACAGSGCGVIDPEHIGSVGTLRKHRTGE